MALNAARCSSPHAEVNEQPSVFLDMVATDIGSISSL